MDSTSKNTALGGKTGAPTGGAKPFNGGDPLMQKKNSAQASVRRPVATSGQVVASGTTRAVVQNNAGKVASASRVAAPASAGVANKVTTAKTGNASDGSSTVAQKKTGASKSSKKNITTILVAVGALAILAGIIVAVVLNLPHGDSGEDETGGGDVVSVNTDVLTEEDEKTTKNVIDKYAEVKVGDIQEYEDELGKHIGVNVAVTNISEETVSIAVDLAAMGKDGNVLDKSSLYAEGIAPGQTYNFQTFSYTTLSLQELKDAEIKVYKAYTYVSAGSGETVEIENSVETSESETESQGEAKAEATE